MDDEREDFIDKLVDAIAEARSKMTPIQRVFVDIRTDEIMERSANHFWIDYRLKNTRKRLLTQEQLHEIGHELEVKLSWLIEHAAFSFKEYGATDLI